jgi:hypothetical protein
MKGYLDKDAPSIESEYSRYIDGDIFGKILFKNIMTRVVGITPEGLQIPLGRHGDRISGKEQSGDAQVSVNNRWYDCEIKFARVNIANKTLGQTEENWAFASLLTTPTGGRKTYDIAIAIGARVLGIEDDRYWGYLNTMCLAHQRAGRAITPEVLPHQEEFLSLCGIFILPRQVISGKGYFRVTLRALAGNKYRDYFAWTHDYPRVRSLWHSAIDAANE